MSHLGIDRFDKMIAPSLPAWRQTVGHEHTWTTPNGLWTLSLSLPAGGDGLRSGARFSGGIWSATVPTDEAGLASLVEFMRWAGALPNTPVEVKL